MAAALIGQMVAWCCRQRWLVVLFGLALGVAAGVFSLRHFAMNSDTEALISAHLPWRQRDIAYDRAFPAEANQIVVVIDGKTPEIAEDAAARLAADLLREPGHFRSVERPDGGPFFARNGLLYLPLSEVRNTVAQLIKAQPFLGPLALDPTLHGIIQSLSTVLTGVERKDTSLDDLKPTLAAFDKALSAAADGKQAFFSWRGLMAQGKSSPRETIRETRKFVIVDPVLDFSALMPGSRASEAIRAAARRLDLTPAEGVTVRLTGEVALNDAQFATLAQHVGLMLGVMGALVVLMLWLAVRSVRLILCILATLLVGLAATAAFGLIAIGPFNIISVAFITLCVGLGVDFGIQFTVRFLAERQRQPDQPLEQALALAGRGVGPSLALAAAAIAAGFYAFLPTDYVGVTQLGLIAGTGMIIAFLLSISLLPALIAVARPRMARGEVGYHSLAPVDTFLLRRRRRILLAAAGLAVLAAALVPWLRFDFNPLDLQSPKTEAVATLLDLMRDPDTNPNTINILAPSLARARALANRLDSLPEVSRAMTIESFVPGDQGPKLALISDAEMLLGPTLDPFGMPPASGDAETRQVMQATAARLLAVAGSAATPAAGEARHLATTLQKLALGPKASRARAAAIMVPGLKVFLSEIRALLQAGPVTLESLPKSLTATWVTADGRYRVEAVPQGEAKDLTGEANDPTGDANDDRTIRRFVAAVHKVAPEATGTPVSIFDSGRTIEHAFILAGLWSALLVTGLLALVLRRLSHILLTLAPLGLTGLLTLATCAALGQPLNFANIIALPLLFGIGTAFNIYFVMAWRAGRRNLLQSSLTRAIVFSALTTASAFGSLWLSSHPGTASMGKLLIISLGWTLFCTLLILPALLGSPPRLASGHPPVHSGG